MVRPLRIQYEGAFYHVISRGNAGQYLYVSEEDKGYFLQLLGRGAERYEVEVYAYCVMGTHYHLLVQTIRANLSEFMHFLGSSYGNYMVRKGWVGHVFAGRYKAICIQKEEYLLVVSRYIHLNPVGAGLVRRPEDYRWSSYSHIVEDKNIPSWLNRGWLEEYFGPGMQDAKARYREFMEAVSDGPPPYPHENIVAQAILGNEEFVTKIKSIVGRENKPIEAAGRLSLAKPLTLEGLYGAVCRYYGLPDLVDRSGDKRRLCNQARKSFIYMAREYTPATYSEISELLSDVTPNGVSRHYNRLTRELAVNYSLRGDFMGDVSRVMSHVRA